MCVYISRTRTRLALLHPAATVRQLGDIEAGTGETQQLATKNTPGDNRRLTTVFRREKAQRKRQTEARNTDGIMGGGKDRDRI